MTNFKKQLNVGTILSALIISTILFLAGIYVGYGISTQKLSVIETEILDITRDIENFQLQFLLLDMFGENATCPLLKNTLSDINKRCYSLGSRLESANPESEILTYDEYINLKKEYSRVLIGYWLLANKFQKSCVSNMSTIVYFYSKECNACKDQGFVLTYLKNKYGEKVLIFALDTDLEEPSIEAIKNHYNIKIYPSLIVNGKLYEGFQSVEKLENMVGG
jgi:hypothetical protein